MLDGAARVGEVVAAAAADGQPAIGITDHGNLYGVLDFYKAAQTSGHQADHRHARPTRPTTAATSARPAGAGSTTRGGDADGGRKLYYHLTLLAENSVGYRNLIQLASRAFLEGYCYKPRVDWELLDAAQRGRHRHHRLPRRPRAAVAAAGRLRGRAARRPAGSRTSSGRDNLFVELQDHGHRRAAPHQPAAARHRPPARRAAARHQRQPLRRTASDAVAHDALLCVQTGSLMSDPDRFKFHGDEHYLKTAAEMRDAVRASFPRPATTRCWIAERCDVEIEFGQPKLPGFPDPRRASPTTATTSGTSPSRAREPALGDPCPTPPIERRRLRARRHRRHGVQLLLPDRLGPDPLRPRARHPGRPGAG